jgi:hypothetical protein
MVGEPIGEFGRLLWIEGRWTYFRHSQVGGAHSAGNAQWKIKGIPDGIPFFRLDGVNQRINRFASATSKLSPSWFSTSSPVSGISPEVDWLKAIFLAMRLRQSICAVPS